MCLCRYLKTWCCMWNMSLRLHNVYFIMTNKRRCEIHVLPWLRMSSVHDFWLTSHAASHPALPISRRSGTRYGKLINDYLEELTWMRRMTSNRWISLHELLWNALHQKTSYIWRFSQDSHGTWLVKDVKWLDNFTQQSSRGRLCTQWRLKWLVNYYF